MAVTNSDPKRVNFILGGAILSGFNEDTFLEVEEMNDGFTDAIGADGDIARSRNSDGRHEIRATFLQGSKANDILSTFYTADRASEGGLLIPAMVQDMNGSSLFVAAQAWIVKRATLSYGKAAGSRLWTIRTGEPTVFIVGGASNS